MVSSCVIIFVQVSSCVNSSPPSVEYMHHSTGSALVQVMACHLFGTKPLPEQMLTNCQLDSWEQMPVRFELEFYHFHSRKRDCNCRLRKWRPFCREGYELIATAVFVVPAAIAMRYSWFPMWSRLMFDHVALFRTKMFFCMKYIHS